MKLILIGFCLILAIAFSNHAIGQEGTMDNWNTLLNKAELADYFQGVFNKMCFVIEETGEKFTVIHEGDHFTIREGVDETGVDYVVHLKLINIQNMVKHGDDNKIDEYESFKIMSVLFTPLTEASLTNPTLSKPFLRRMSGIENHIHINLISPEGEETVSHTLIYLNKKWMVIPGIHGQAKRVFNLSQQDAVDYQRKVFVALNQNNTKSWKKFKKWYINWRKETSIPLD